MPIHNILSAEAMAFLEATEFHVHAPPRPNHVQARIIRCTYMIQRRAGAVDREYCCRMQQVLLPGYQMMHAYFTGLSTRLRPAQ